MAVNKYIGDVVYKRIKSVRSLGKLTGLCYLCHHAVSAAESSLCESCVFDLPAIGSPCLVCAMPTAAGDLCAGCIQETRPVIDRSFCPYRYAYPVNKLIQDMKFNSRLDLAAFFAQAIIDSLYANFAEIPQCLIPVPLHFSRLRQRGYNQSHELAAHLSLALNVPVNTGLTRTRKTRIQSGLIAEQRKSNLRNAFAVNKKVLSGCDHVAIVDDVITTGATVKEIARLLKASGFSRVDVWACARAVV